MRSIRSLVMTIAAASACAVTAPGAADSAPPAPFEGRIEQVAPGVYAALQPERLRFFDGNAAFVVGDDGVMVVDSFHSPGKARRLLGEIRKITDKPVRWLVTSHAHGDHVAGHQVFDDAGPGRLVVIGHDTAPSEMRTWFVPETAKELAKLPKDIADSEEALRSGKMPDGSAVTDELRPRLERGLQFERNRLEELKSLRVVEPNLTFDGAMTIWSGTREIRLFSVRAHTVGDVLVYLPKERVLITGDVLDDLPFAGYGWPADWLRTLHDLDRMDVTKLITGHGRVREGKDHLHLVIEFFDALTSEVRSAVAAGKGLEEVKKAVTLEAFRPRLAGDDAYANRTFSQFVPAAVSRAFKEANGTIQPSGPGEEP